MFAFSNFRNLSILVALGSVLLGCAKAPQEKVLITQKLLDTARNEKVDIYAKALFTKAQDSLNAAMGEIDRVGSSAAFENSYARAESLIIKSQQLVQMARDSASMNRALLKRECDSLISLAQISVDSVDRLIVSISKRKKHPVSLDSLSQQIDSVKVIMKDASTAFISVDYKVAQVNALAALSKADSILATIHLATIHLQNKRE